MLKSFVALISIAVDAGTVTQAMMYESGFVTIEGKTHDGKNFSITMNVKEEETDGKSV